MSYQKAEHVLPADLLEKIQKYIDGEVIYIPRVPDKKRKWGTATATRQELEARNRQIYLDYLGGCRVGSLALQYFLSEKSIQRIVGQQKKKGCP